MKTQAPQGPSQPLRSAETAFSLIHARKCEADRKHSEHVLLKGAFSWETVSSSMTSARQPGVPFLLRELRALVEQKREKPVGPLFLEQGFISSRRERGEHHEPDSVSFFRISKAGLQALVIP